MLPVAANLDERNNAAGAALLPHQCRRHKLPVWQHHVQPAQRVKLLPAGHDHLGGRLQRVVDGFLVQRLLRLLKRLKDVTNRLVRVIKHNRLPGTGVPGTDGTALGLRVVQWVGDDLDAVTLHRRRNGRGRGVVATV
jgi:hypothetical protein